MTDFDPSKTRHWRRDAVPHAPAVPHAIDPGDARDRMTTTDLELHRRSLRRAVWGAFEPHEPAPEAVDRGLDELMEPAPEPAPEADAQPSHARAKHRLLTFLFVGLCLLVGCERKQGIVLWHAYNGAERDALESTAAKWNTEHPDQPVELVAVPYGAFADKLTSAIPGGNGPDLFIYPQDRIGDWADSGVIEPIEFWLDDAHVDRFSSEAVSAMAYKGSLWGLPVTVKSLALYYRTDLVATPPKTTDELLALAPRMKAKDGYAIAYANVDLYGHAPWLFGYGGKVMDDRGQLAIATPEAANAMTFARTLVTTGAAPENAEGPLVATLFNDGKAATVVSGPWFVADINASVPWQVTTLPTVSATGRPAAPFLGAEGILMSARAHDKATAFAVMDALTSDVAAIERAKHARQVVPNVAAYSDPDVAADPALVAFRAQLANTVPMPMGPAMRMVWTPYKTALGEVLAGRAEPGERLIAVEREVAGYLTGPGRQP
ncbi:MAG TPA: extracellular solute-binding protein [Kofleriaceae bacterium]|nr:extracellular solute-binding protein [Kofleriaceae bacterium]